MAKETGNGAIKMLDDELEDEEKKLSESDEFDETLPWISWLSMNYGHVQISSVCIQQDN